MQQLQKSFDIPIPDYISETVQQSIEELAKNPEANSRGAIFTRREVVGFILDLVGYTDDKPLHQMRILEPAFGNGDFLLPVVERLISAWRKSESEGSIAVELKDAIRSVELHYETFGSTHSSVVALLKSLDIPIHDASLLADEWLLQGDFLLTRMDGNFDFVVGNPPYIRQELIPTPLLAEYRTRFQTIYDRADIYIPFIERGLTLLSTNGCLGFICADRWMKNKYGGPLRRFIAENFHLKIYVDMVDTPAFHSNVSAYPAITIFTVKKQKVTRIASQPKIETKALSTLSHLLSSTKLHNNQCDVKELNDVIQGTEPWLLDTSGQMALVRRLEGDFPLIEETGCKIGIGVATGADKAFIADYDSLDVEPDRKLSLVTTKDIASGVVDWRGLGVINPFSDSGGLVDLEKYPKLKCYLEGYYDVIASRHCAKKTPDNWYRTIDRISPELAVKKKLLIPDIKGKSHIVFENGKLYPHHNLYYITSDTWDLRSLQAVLLSTITRIFISTYSTKMRGGFLRFQAQYLRRIRLPQWEKVPNNLRKELSDAAINRDLVACDEAVCKLYQLTKKEQIALTNTGE